MAFSSILSSACAHDSLRAAVAAIDLWMVCWCAILLRFKFEAESTLESTLTRERGLPWLSFVGVFGDVDAEARYGLCPSTAC